MKMESYCSSTEIKSSAAELIGNTPLVALDSIWPGPGRILAKCEFMNPSGSVKDRAAHQIIKTARSSGDLKPGSPVVEMTSGNMGAGLAMICSALGHPLTVTMSTGNSPQRRTQMRALGATVELVDQVNGTPGNVTLADIKAAEVRALGIVRETGAFYSDQFNNPNNVLAHEEHTGPEIWRQTGGNVDAFLCCVGTAGTFMGVSNFLRKMNPEVKCFVVEPKNSQPIKGCEIQKPQHILQGSGYSMVPPFFKYENIDGTFAITDEEAVEYRKLLATKEGLHVGYTSAANVAAAVKLLKSGQLGKSGGWVVTVLPDTGLKYS